MFLLQSDIIPSVQEAFTSGTLVMPTEIVPSATAALSRWGDVPVNGWLIVISALCMVIDISGLYYIFADLTRCLSRWRWNLTAEASMQFSRERDILAMLSILPVTVLASRFGMLSPGFIGRLPVQWQSLALLGMVVSYVILRLICFLALGYRARRVSNYRAAHTATWNIFIMYALALMLSVGTLWFCGVDDAVIRTVGLAETLFFYVIAIGQKFQILGSSCNPFTTFLYLCALEFLPTGLLIAANICL